MEHSGELEAWVATVDMGLGHQRAVYPLRHLARGGIITGGLPEYSDQGEVKLWKRLRHSYEFLSRVRSVPVIGKPLFRLLDNLQNIPPFYPLQDMTKPSYQVKLLESLVRKGLGSGLLKTIEEKPLPLVSSHPVPALAADSAGIFRNYCIVCDAEISRAWVANEPTQSRIEYLAPCGNAVQRLRRYGVPEERIHLTGFPLPLELLGDEEVSTLKQDVGQRLNYLDPNHRFWQLHQWSAEHFLGAENIAHRNERVLEITYAVGGAGAQREIGYQIAKSLRERLVGGVLRLNLVAGIRPEVRDYFLEAREELGLAPDQVRVIYGETMALYFDAFTQTIRHTDVLWTKPSELSFYAGLGLPIIMAPTIGAQEEFNRKWLQEIQAGIPQDYPEYAHEWLMELLERGRLAESAWDGFLKGRHFGTYKVMEVLQTGAMERERSPLRR
jgi:hypothetical protein